LKERGKNDRTVRTVPQSNRNIVETGGNRCHKAYIYKTAHCPAFNKRLGVSTLYWPNPPL